MDVPTQELDRKRPSHAHPLGLWSGVSWRSRRSHLGQQRAVWPQPLPAASGTAVVLAWSRCDAALAATCGCRWGLSWPHLFITVDCAACTLPLWRRVPPGTATGRPTSTQWLWPHHLLRAQPPAWHLVRGPAQTLPGPQRSPCAQDLRLRPWHVAALGVGARGVPLSSSPGAAY